jgi:hypothetical protein
MAAECHSVNDKTKIEADNVVLYYEKKTWRILILVIAEMGRTNGASTTVREQSMNCSDTV